jgi:hypothetical protein
VPAAFEQSWVNIYGIFGSGLTPRENFLFSVATDPPHTYFNFLVSGIALEQIALFAFALPFAWKVRKGFPRLLLPALAAIGIASVLMMFRFSSIFWSLPKMQFIQFPWRWMLVLNLALCVIGMIALTSARTKWIWVVLMVTFLGYTERDVIRQATWGKRSISEMYWSTSVDGYRGAKEYLPHEVHVAPKPYVLPDVPLVQLSCEIPCAQNDVTILHWSEEAKKMQVSVAVPASLTLKLYDYPAWQVWLDGSPLQHETTYSGQIKLEIPPGPHKIAVRFIRTEDRTIGTVISVASAIGLLIFTFFTGSRARQGDASNRGVEQAISS